MTAYLIFLGGLTALLVAGHLLVTGASIVGRRLGLSATVIGLTIVAAGTSAPELAVFARAIQVDDTELAVGSVVGSNIANVLLVLGLVAALGTVRLASRLVRTDVPVMIGASIVFLFFALDGVIRQIEAAVLVFALVAYIASTIHASRREGNGSRVQANGLGFVARRGIEPRPESRKGSRPRDARRRGAHVRRGSRRTRS